MSGVTSVTSELRHLLMYNALFLTPPSPWKLGKSVCSRWQPQDGPASVWVREWLCEQSLSRFYAKHVMWMRSKFIFVKPVTVAGCLLPQQNLAHPDSYRMIYKALCDPSPTHFPGCIVSFSYSLSYSSSTLLVLWIPYTSSSYRTFAHVTSFP